MIEAAARVPVIGPYVRLVRDIARIARGLQYVPAPEEIEQIADAVRRELPRKEGQSVWPVYVPKPKVINPGSYTLYHMCPWSHLEPDRGTAWNWELRDYHVDGQYQVGQSGAIPNDEWIMMWGLEFYGHLNQVGMASHSLWCHSLPYPPWTVPPVRVLPTLERPGSLMWPINMPEPSIVPSAVPELMYPGQWWAEPAPLPWALRNTGGLSSQRGYEIENSPEAVGGPARLPTYVITPQPGPVTAQSPRRYEPTKRRKERKHTIQSAMGVFHGIVGTITEGIDAIEAFYEALPKHLRPAIWTGSRWRKATPQEMVAVIYRHFDQLDTASVIWNLVADQVEDAAIGYLAGGAGKHTGKWIGNRSIGMLAGPAL